MKTQNVKDLIIVTLIVSVLMLFGLRLLIPNNGFEDILRYVARGIYGKNALSGDNSMIYKGLLLHIFISFIWVFSFFIMYPNFKFKHPYWLRTGAVLGILICIIMHFGVESAAITKDFPTDIVFLAKSILAHIIAVGLPIAFYYIKYIYKVEPSE